MRVLAIINPVAGGGRVRRVWPPVRDRLAASGWEVQEAVAERRGHETELAGRAAAQGVDAVLAVGGDGTAHWTANGLLRAAEDGRPSPPLGVVPAGTGADFAAALGISRDPGHAASVLLGARPRRIDVGRVNDRYFLTIGTVGFGGEVARQVNAWPRLFPGPVLYLGAILKMLAVYSPMEMEVTLDDTLRRERLFMVAVGNTRLAAGGMQLCPTATPEDQQFEVVRIGNVTKLQVLGLLPKTFSGTHVLHPKVDVTRGRRLTVTSDTPLSIQADGELVGVVPAAFTVVPAALTVLTP